MHMHACFVVINFVFYALVVYMYIVCVVVVYFAVVVIFIVIVVVAAAVDVFCIWSVRIVFH